MPWQLVFTDQYTKRAARFLRQHPQLHEQYAKTLVMLQENPLHPSLRLHPLRGKLSGLHSISINLRYRITMELLITRNEIVPINIGDHDAVY